MNSLTSSLSLLLLTSFGRSLDHYALIAYPLYLQNQPALPENNHGSPPTSDDINGKPIDNLKKKFNNSAAQLTTGILHH